MGVPVPWREAWQQALYGAHGFYRREPGPAGHFTTATHGTLGAVLADALWAWADRLGCESVVDLGAGRGELLAHLRAARPEAPLTGVDVVRRPAGLACDVAWAESPGGGALPEDLRPRGALVVAHEWLDVVPCTVAQVDAAGTLREALVDPSTGRESPGDAVAGADLDWCTRHWPPTPGRALDRTDFRTHTARPEPGERVEIGRARDEAWSDLLRRMDGGVAIAVDYGHTGDHRPRHGSLTAYRHGQRVDPVPDGSCDLTAHVAVDSLRHDRLLTQREALGDVGITGALPEHSLAARDPGEYASRLARASAQGQLLRRDGFGSFWWVVATP